MEQNTRAPIVVVMGHIDHGKSSLLDYIRKTNTIAKEAGGITQHVSAYEVEYEYESVQRKITFLDTPGHEAFHTLRARGASVADIAILVVAADEGFKPQTKDALDAINDAHIPYIVALTKIDKRGADIEHAKTSLLKNEIYLEGLGGSIPYTSISSKTGEGIPNLLDLVLLTADMSELTADKSLPATGFVLESMQDSQCGIAATLIIKNGTLIPHTFVVAVDAYAPVRFIEDFTGKRIQEAGPSMPVRVSGFTTLPLVGMPFTTAKTRKEALAHIDKHSLQHNEQHQTTQNVSSDDIAIIPLVIKADTMGSVDAITHELSKIDFEHAKIDILSSSIGSVTEHDVKTAHAAHGAVIAFHVPIDTVAHNVAERLSIPIESNDIIYDIRTRVEALLKERTPRITTEKQIGEITILKIFSVHSHKHVIGVRLTSGICTVNTTTHILRRGVPLGEGKITNLQQARANVSEIRTEGDCGLEIETRVEIAQGDTLVPYVIVHT